MRLTKDKHVSARINKTVLGIIKGRFNSFQAFVDQSIDDHLLTIVAIEKELEEIKKLPSMIDVMAKRFKKGVKK